MVCEFCGHKNEPGAKFCANCGSHIAANQTLYQPSYQPPDQTQYQPPVQYTPAPGSEPPNYQPSSYQQPNYRPPGQQPPDYRPSDASSKTKTLPIKKLLMIGIPVIVIIIAAIIIIPRLGAPGSSGAKNNISFFTDKGVIIVSGDNNPKFTIDGEMYSSQKSMDGSKAAVLTDYHTNTGGELWYVTTSACYQIAEDVVAYRISDTGNGIVYLTNYDSRNSVATLFLYDTSSRNAARITEDAFYYGSADMMGICVSPNGKSVAYISDYSERNNEFTGYVKIDGKAPEKIGKETFAVAVSDGGRNLYYVMRSDDGNSGSLHVRSGRNDNRLTSDVSLGQTFLLNKDYSEVLYTVDDKTYVSRGGGEKQRVSGAAIYRLVLPWGTQIGTSADKMGITVYGIRSFSDFVAYTGDGLVYVNNRLESSKISSSSNNANRAVVSSDGKTLLFINNNGHLSSVDPTKVGAERRELARNVEAFVASGDAKSIYFINDDDELWYIKGAASPVKISDDVSPSQSHLVLSNNSNRAFFLVDYGNKGGELFYSNNGGRRAKIPGADEIISLWNTPANIFYTNSDSEVFRSNGSEKFSLFDQDIGVGF